MNTKIISASVLAATGFTSMIFGQSPTTPPPAIPNAPTASAAPVAGPAPVAPAAPSATPPNQIVYTAQLPTVQELTNSAAGNGVTLTRVEQSNSEITAQYQLSNGQVSVVSYQLLPAATGTTSVALVTTRTMRVVYVPSAPRIVYYDSYRAVDPWYWYSPVSLSIGLGFRGGGYGYYHGGFGHGFHHRR